MFISYFFIFRIRKKLKQHHKEKLFCENLRKKPPPEKNFLGKACSFEEEKRAKEISEKHENALDGIIPLLRIKGFRRKRR
jgi:hypothetical protein